MGVRYIYLVEDHPLWLSVEEAGAGVDGDDLTVHQGPVTLLRIFLGGVPEEARADCFLNPGGGLPTAYYVQLVSVHDSQQLLPHILSSLQSSLLDEVLVAPGGGELVGLPAVEDGQQSDVVALGLVELGLLLVSQLLLLLGSIENILD